MLLHCFTPNFWRRQWHPTPVLLPGKSHGWRSLVGCHPWVATSRAWLSDFTFTFPFHALEKEMATHSSVLAWRIPGTGEPGGPSSMGSHRVGHDWSDLAAHQTLNPWPSLSGEPSAHYLGVKKKELAHPSGFHAQTFKPTTGRITGKCCPPHCAGNKLRSPSSHYSLIISDS